MKNWKNMVGLSLNQLPSAKQPHNYGTSPFFKGKSTKNCHFQQLCYSTRGHNISCFTVSPTTNAIACNQLNSGKRACKNNRPVIFGMSSVFASLYSSTFFLYSSSKGAFLGFVLKNQTYLPRPHYVFFWYKCKWWLAVGKCETWENQVPKFQRILSNCPHDILLSSII